jgi:cytosine/adenosine deaminase-related metal-dependent hydrolase
MGIHDHRLEVGAPANLVVLEGSNVLEALRFHRAPRVVIRNGRFIDERAD